MAENTTYGPFLGAAGVRKLKAWIGQKFLGKEDSAASAAKLDTASAGTATKPVYFSEGVPVAGTYELNKSVPADAAFTDTTYSDVVAGSATSGLMTGADKTRLDGMGDGAQANAFEAMQLNGTDLPITGKKSNLTVAAGTADGSIAIGGTDYTPKNLKKVATTGAYSDLTGAPTLGTAAGAEVETTLTDGSNLPTGSAVKGYVESAIDEAVTGVYTPGPSGTLATLPSLTKANLGKVTNLSEDIATTEDFVEGAGVKVAKGSNVVVVNAGTKSSPSYKYDVMGAAFDTSGFVQSSEISEMTAAQVESILAED